MPTLIINGQEVNNITLNGTDVEQISDGVNTLWEKGTPIGSPLRVVNNVAGSAITVTLTRNGSPADIDIEYSTDNANWTTWTETNGVRSMSIAQNGNLFLRGNNPNGLNPTNSDSDYYSFTADKKYAMAGDIRSLISRYEIDDIPNSCFRKFFYNSTTLDNASYMSLKATKPGQWAYLHLFGGCTGLKLAPHELPATNLVNENNSDGRCYGYMFKNCSSLTTMPIIRATRFGYQACYEMFNGCSALTKQWATATPSDSSTTNISFTIESGNNKTHCFYAMFQGCTSLVDASGITATKTAWAANECYNMFYGCTALTSAPSITFGSFASGNAHCQQMFYNCTSLVSTPNIHLNATTVYQQTYKNMYRGCTKLTSAPEIKATTMFADVNNGSLVGMFYGCSALTYIKVNFTDWNSGNYTTQWTYGVHISGRFDCPTTLTATKNTDAFNIYDQTSYIPQGWGVNKYSSWDCTDAYFYKQSSGANELMRITIKKWNGSFPTSGAVGGNRSYAVGTYSYPSPPSNPSATASVSVNGSGQMFFNVGSPITGTRYYAVKFRMATKDSSSNDDTIWCFYKTVTNP